MNPEYYPIITGAIGGVISAGVFKGPIESLTQIWYLTLGRFSDDVYQRYKVKQAIDIENLRKRLEDNIKNISEENIQEPKISVVGPALEASKFYMDEEEIREMFAKLITSSMDSSKADDIHPSFVGMIGNLSPLDAKNLFYLYKDLDGTISKIRSTFENAGHYSYTDNIKHIFLGNPECQDHKLMEASIDNLIRLNLVDVSYGEKRTDLSLYDKHINNPLLLSVKEEQEKNCKAYDMLSQALNDGITIKDKTQSPISSEEQEQIMRVFKTVKDFKKVDVVKGVIRLTAFGKNFCKVCL